MAARIRGGGRLGSEKHAGVTRKLFLCGHMARGRREARLSMAGYSVVFPFYIRLISVIHPLYIGCISRVLFEEIA